MKTYGFKNINDIKSIRFIFAAAVITFLTFVFGDYLTNTLQDESSFSALFKSPDYILMDLYESAAEDNPQGKLNPYVIIVDDTDCNHSDLSSLISAIDSLEPAAIGIDHIFLNSRDFSALADAVRHCKTPIVLGSEVVYDGDRHQFTSIINSYFSDSLCNSTNGALNLGDPSITRDSAIRKVVRKYTCTDTISINSFAYELASKSGFISCKKTEQFNSSFIRFRETSAMIISWKKIIGNDRTFKFDNAIKEKVRGKIVLMGSKNDQSDYHLITGERYLSGIEIHAASIFTVIDENYMKVSPNWINNLISIIFVFVFSLLLYYTNRNMSYIGNLCVRIVQTCTILFFIFVGYYFYIIISNPIYIDFSISILMIGISAFVFDIVNGMYGLLKSIYKKIQ